MTLSLKPPAANKFTNTTATSCLHHYIFYRWQEEEPKLPQTYNTWLLVLILLVPDKHINHKPPQPNISFITSLPRLCLPCQVLCNLQQPVCLVVRAIPLLVAREHRGVLVVAWCLPPGQIAVPGRADKCWTVRMPGAVSDDRTVPRELLDGRPGYHIVNMHWIITWSSVYVPLARAVHWREVAADKCPQNWMTPVSCQRQIIWMLIISSVWWERHPSVVPVI